MRDGIRRFIEADVKCYHCGAIIGTLRREDGVSGATPVLRDRDGSTRLSISNLALVRCTKCGGPVFADELETVYEYPVGAWAADRPRRGRPRKIRPA